jgi:hypothetical protein
MYIINKQKVEELQDSANASDVYSSYRIKQKSFKVQSFTIHRENLMSLM